ncbi:MAG: hypothetical protein AAGA72_05255 [Pseudomonadota bacterium]
MNDGSNETSDPHYEGGEQEVDDPTANELTLRAPDGATGIGDVFALKTFKERFDSDEAIVSVELGDGKSIALSLKISGRFLSYEEEVGMGSFTICVELDKWLSAGEVQTLEEAFFTPLAEHQESVEPRPQFSASAEYLGDADARQEESVKRNARRSGAKGGSAKDNGAKKQSIWAAAVAIILVGIGVNTLVESNSSKEPLAEPPDEEVGSAAGTLSEPVDMQGLREPISADAITSEFSLLLRGLSIARETAIRREHNRITLDDDALIELPKLLLDTQNEVRAQTLSIENGRIDYLKAVDRLARYRSSSPRAYEAALDAVRANNLSQREARTIGAIEDILSNSRNSPTIIEQGALSIWSDWIISS